MPAAAILSNPLARFFAILVGVYTLWFAAYDLWLLPDGRLDEWLSLHVVTMTTGLMNTVGLETFAEGRHVWMPGTLGVLIEDDCNGIGSLGLFVAFVLAYPGSWRQRAWFLPMGLAVVYGVNVLRIAALIMIQAQVPALFDIAHELGTTLIFYAAIFGLWMVWARLGDGSRLRQRGHLTLAAA